jgi:hypothetical protein
MQIIPPTLASIMAKLISPYGLELLTFLLRTATVQPIEVNDWQPLKPVSIFDLFYLLVLILSFYWLARSSQPRRPILLWLFGTTTLLPRASIRHLPFLYTAELVFISEHAGSVWNGVKPQKKRMHSPSIWVAGLPITNASASLIRLVSARDFLRIPVSVNGYPITTVTLLKKSGVSGNLATEFSWGEYIIWHTSPQIKVSIDGRRETIYPTDIYQQNLDFLNGSNDWATLLRLNRTDMALVKKGAPDYNLLKLTPGWLLVYEDSSSALFVNKATSLVEPLLQAVAGFAPLPANGYFP